MDNTGVNGNYLSSEGLEGNDVWGTRAEWVKLYSTIDEEPVSITILDHPKMLATPPIGMQEITVFFQPTHWVKKFFQKVESSEFALLNGESVTFHYRMLVHNGSVLDPKDIKKVFVGQF